MLRARTAALLLLASIAVAASAEPAPAPPPGQPAPTPVPDVTVAPDEARKTALEFAQSLQDDYAFPDVAARYAAMLRSNAASGAYDGLTSGKALAERLTADLRAVSPDNHLRVRVAPPRQAQASGAAQASPIRRMVPLTPIEEQRWLAPGIAYIRFNLFPGDAETVAAVRKFMADHADAKTIIFDNRTHHGGGLAQMDAMFPYLFPRPTTLVAMVETLIHASG